MLEEVFALVRSGRMDPKTGATLGFVAGTLFKGHVIASMEERIEQLEVRNRELSQLAEIPPPPERIVYVHDPPQEEFDKAVEANYNKPPSTAS